MTSWDIGLIVVFLAMLQGAAPPAVVADAGSR
jgi:hypothetical protein